MENEMTSLEFMCWCIVVGGVLHYVDVFLSYLL